ncbi:FG-GAP repeat protein [Crateriforma conspicua]|uniref:FG-GAP repeat protein n=1 Tax=Crateriforma conspicua TaxID=2527996 RepID=A0A5C6FT34_9PLAN|nr:exo-alpha-sialidase [Crateriforma conspicua]TWU65476.1 FG-GAP repeat protein [Crateriforma conspicua]
MMTAFRIALLLSLFGVSGYGRVMAAEPDQWKLQPLKYNHPGLQVDLGVGLWAWPLPMDYDGDGDMDLLVSCPDKPSNGVYYFENPTKDPSVKMPVFKAGVRLGPTKTNTQVSYVDGQPRLLVENNELTAFRDGDFSTQQSIYPDARFHPGKTRARMWRYVDWEGDGDQDLIVGIGDWSDYVWDQAYDAQGRWQNGPLHGYVYLIERTSGDDYAQPRKISAGGSPIDVFGWPSPNFADFDGDGDLDLICGEFLDGFTYFENVGSRSQPSYAVGVKLNGDDGRPLVMNLQMITPTAIDWDRDGDMDLIVGDEDGRVALVENVTSGEASTPVFRQPVYFQQEADTLKFGALATPFAHDWDGDGDEDILCGNTAGNIALFENLDGKGQRWSAPELLQVDGKVFRIMAGPNGSIQGPAEAKWGYTTLSVADWNGDGADDILVNSIWPRLTLLCSTKNGLTEQPLPFWNREMPPRFYWWNQPAENQQSQWRTTPLATDWDQDGQLDLVILDQEGYLTCQSRANDQTRVFVDEDGRPVRMNAKSAGGSGRIKLALVDWDGDGRQDILTNSENAVWWRNCEERDGKTVLKRIGNLAKRNVAGHTSSPAVCDFDGNGKPDLLVGAENGRIYFIRHEDCTQFPADQLVARKPKPADTPRFPGLVDDEFIYTNASFPQCHASTICETDRGLVAAWFGGTREKHPDVGIWSSYHDGNQWKRPIEVANGVQHDGLRYPCWNPVLFQPPGDAPLMLFFKVGPNARDWWGEVMFSYDGGRSFRDRRRLPETIDGPVRSKPMLLSDGTLLCPSSSEHDDDWRMHYEILSDLRHPELGTSWRRIEPENQPFQVIQPSFLTHSDGRIQALMRSKHSKIFQAATTDSGNTWSEMTELGLPNPNSGIEALTLADGRHLLLYNHAGGNRKDGWGSRQTLHLAISSNGIDWNKAAVVEHVDKGELSYPAMIQSRDGKVHVTYTWMRKRVKHLVIDPDGLETGAELGLDPWEAN